MQDWPGQLPPDIEAELNKPMKETALRVEFWAILLSVLGAFGWQIASWLR